MSTVHQCAACAQKNKEMLFVNTDCLLAHIRKNHVDNAPRYPCPVCGSQFLTEQRLARHLIYSDPTQNPTQCGRYMSADDKPKASDTVLAYQIMELSVQERMRNKAIKQEIGTDDNTGNFNNKAPDVTANATEKRANRSPVSPIPPEPNSRNQERQTSAPPKEMRTEVGAASQAPGSSCQSANGASKTNFRNQEHQMTALPKDVTMRTGIAATSQAPGASCQSANGASKTFRNQEHQTFAPPNDVTVRTEAAASQAPIISCQIMSSSEAEQNLRNQERQTFAPPNDTPMQSETATASQIPSISRKEMSPAKDAQTIRNEEHQTFALPKNTTMEIAAANQIPSTSRQEDDEQSRAIQSLLSGDFGSSDFGDTDNWLEDYALNDTPAAMTATPVNEDIGFEPQDNSYLNLNPPLSDALVQQQIEYNNNLMMAEAQNPANLHLNKENTPPPDSARTAGPSNAGNTYQMPKIVIAPARNLQKTPKPGPSKKSILVADRPATNERSAEKKVRFISGDTLEKIKNKVAVKRKIESDEESSGSSSESESTNTSQGSSSSSSSSSNSPPRSPSPQYEPVIPPAFEPIIPVTYTRPQTARRGRKRVIREPARRGLNRSIQEPSRKYNTRLRVRERGDSKSPDPDFIHDDEKEAKNKAGENN